HAASAALTRGPYLQRGTPTSITVRWRTDNNTDSRVRYGASPASVTNVADNLTSTTEHIVTVSGLSPSTQYYYSVGSTGGTLAGGDANHFFITSPPVGTSRPTRGWVIRDSGTPRANPPPPRPPFPAST